MSVLAYLMAPFFILEELTRYILAKNKEKVVWKNNDIVNYATKKAAPGSYLAQILDKYPETWKTLSYKMHSAYLFIFLSSQEASLLNCIRIQYLELISIGTNTESEEEILRTITMEIEEIRGEAL